MTLANADAATATFTAPDVTADETLTFSVTVTDNSGATATDTVNIGVKWINSVPTVNAGADQIVPEQSVVSLLATATDGDGTIVSYAWVQTAGTTVTLANADAATSTFTAPDVTADETLTFELTVTDNAGATATDSVNVLVNWLNITPVADAGADSTAFIDDVVTLTGLASDGDGDSTIVSYEWTQSEGTSVTLVNANTANASFTVPNIAADEVLTFQLMVTDNGGAIATDTVNINVMALYQGTFAYGPTEGLTYTTATQSGTTDVNGHYYYKAGETIQFSVGDILIGDEVAATPELALHELIDHFELFTNNTDYYRWDSWTVFSSNTKTAFYRFKNTLSFLQTLDEDANPDNGLTIADGIAALLAGIRIDFTDSNFLNNHGGYGAGRGALRYVAHKAVNNGLLSAGAVRNPLVALDQYYRAMGLSYSLHIPLQAVTQSGYTYASVVDGSGNMIEYLEGNDYHYYYSYDDNGGLLDLQEDWDNDSSINLRAVYQYDANGNLLLEERDTNGDGVVNRRYTYTYDSFGNRTSYEFDNDANGVFDGRYEYSYDSTYLLTEERFYQNGDLSTVKRVNTYQYNAVGQLTEHAQDSNGDGTLNWVFTYNYDAQGNRIYEAHDSNADGVNERETTYTHDAAGRVLSDIEERFTAGVLSQTRTSLKTYDANGNVLTYQRYSDGVLTSESTYQYNADNTQSHYANDDDGDGAIDYYAYYSYDANGQRIKIEEDYDADGTIDYVRNNTYDANGFLTEESRDSGNDGSVEGGTIFTPQPASWLGRNQWDDIY